MGERYRNTKWTIKDGGNPTPEDAIVAILQDIRERLDAMFEYMKKLNDPTCEGKGDD